VPRAPGPKTCAPVVSRGSPAPGSRFFALPGDVAGRRTLAPWSPPRHLVTTGLYRYSRNPMYVAVTSMLSGWALCFAASTLAIYTGFVIGAFHLRVVYGEEPWLARTFGVEWENYRARVPRWLV
jgi:protein-S-isoprenylcysteine O-methyltransferase Ste14